MENLRTSSRLYRLSSQEWKDIHDPEKCNALTVTRLVQYMGFGYDAPCNTLRKKEHSDFVKSLLEYGRNMEEIAARVIPLFHKHYGFIEYDIPKKNEIWLCEAGMNPPSERYRKSMLWWCEDKDAGKPVYGSPDMIAIDADNQSHVIEIKCPKDSICLVDIDTDEKLEQVYKEKAYINSNQPRILKKLMGHVIQAAAYSWILSKEQRRAPVSDECTLMYFYPDIAANKYLIIAYDIDWQTIFDEDGDGWDIEEIILEYYAKFVDIWKIHKDPEPFLSKIRRGVYPLLNGDITFKGLLSKGIVRTRMLIAGGESTKEITSYALGQFLPGQAEKTSLEC